MPATIKRLIYLVYYIKELDHKKFLKFFKFVRNNTGISRSKLIRDILLSSLEYNISLLEYFLFRFYELNKNDRAMFAGTGFMYEYQLKMNPPGSRETLINKIEFLKKFKTFVKHKHASIKTLREYPSLIQELLNNKSGRLVLKNSKGQCGKGIEVIDTSQYTSQGLFKRMKKNNSDLVEEFVDQHDSLNKLSSAGLNTVRIITQLNERNVDILGARLRITVNSHVDNLAAGNIAAPIDQTTGEVYGPAVYSDITKNYETIHPITKVPILGFKVPFWQETIEMIKAAAITIPECRSVGWDIAITNEGPELIEGNHDWCKLLWQLPVKTGLKPLLKDYN